MSEDKKAAVAKAKNARAESTDEKIIGTQVDASKPEPDKQDAATDGQAVVPPNDTAAEAASQVTSPPDNPDDDGDSAARQDEESVEQIATASLALKEVEIYPLRSYLDVGEIKRRGGPSYTVPRRHADALIAQRLASTEKPKA